MSGPEESRPPAAPEASGKPTGEPKPCAPKPVTMLSGTGGYTPSCPKRTQVPPGHPDYYPNGLKVETDAIVSSAIVKFAEQTQASQLCKYVITEITNPFLAALSTQEIKAHEVKGHVERLIRWLLVYNCDYSREGYTLKNEIRNSAEWLKLLQEVAHSVKRLECGHESSTTTAPVISNDNSKPYNSESVSESASISAHKSQDQSEAPAQTSQSLIRKSPASEAYKKTENRDKSRSLPRREKFPRMGDSSLLGNAESVNFQIADQYLGLTNRQRQNLVSKEVLKTVGGGHNRRITTDSLRKYLAPINLGNKTN
jgi:hypothetical protein